MTLVTLKFRKDIAYVRAHVRTEILENHVSYYNRNRIVTAIFRLFLIDFVSLQCKHKM